jgi:hypothetical protein
MINTESFCPIQGMESIIFYRDKRENKLTMNKGSCQILMNFVRTIITFSMNFLQTNMTLNHDNC